MHLSPKIKHYPCCFRFSLFGLVAADHFSKGKVVCSMNPPTSETTLS